MSGAWVFGHTASTRARAGDDHPEQVFSLFLSNHLTRCRVKKGNFDTCSRERVHRGGSLIDCGHLSPLPLRADYWYSRINSKNTAKGSSIS